MEHYWMLTWKLRITLGDFFLLYSKCVDNISLGTSVIFVIWWWATLVCVHKDKGNYFLVREKKNLIKNIWKKNNRHHFSVQPATFECFLGVIMFFFFFKTYYSVQLTINQMDTTVKKTHTLFQIAATGALKTNCRETHGPPRVQLTLIENILI